MEETDRYTQRTYFKEHETDAVKGFIILSVDEGGYLVGEKWLNGDNEGEWHDFHVGEAQLNARVNDGKCEAVGQISEEQFEKVLKLTGVDVKDEESRKITA